MRRVLVIGSGGAGKSTFSARLAGSTGLPLIHLDAHYWRAGWAPLPEREWTRRVEELTAGDAWVMDGNYGGSLDARLAACDTVVFLDIPRVVCVRRAVRRWLRFRGRSRPDVTEGCPERLTLEYLWWIWTYPSKRRPAVLRRLEQLRSDQRAIVLRSQADIDAFLKDRGNE